MCYSALIRRQYKDLEKRFGKITVRTDMDWVRDDPPNDDYRKAVAVRVFPGIPGPVLWRDGTDLVQDVMGYGAHLPPHISEEHGKKLTTYNARYDNLDSRYWEHAFLKRHGVAWLTGFFEHVKVADLLKAKVVTLEQVREQFETQAAARKAKILAQGKPYKPTKTELADPRFRNTIIEFRPEEDTLMLAPVIISQRAGEFRFAIITDDPPLEVSNAGHDRCPILLSEEGAELWLSNDSLKRNVAYEALAKRKRPTFTHRLDVAA